MDSLLILCLFTFAAMPVAILYVKISGYLIDRTATEARMQQATAGAGMSASPSRRTTDPGTSSEFGADPGLLTTTLLAATAALSIDSGTSCSSSSGTSDSSSSDSGSSSC